MHKGTNTTQSLALKAQELTLLVTVANSEKDGISDAVLGARFFLSRATVNVHLENLQKKEYIFRSFFKTPRYYVTETGHKFLSKLLER